MREKGGQTIESGLAGVVSDTRFEADLYSDLGGAREHLGGIQKSSLARAVLDDRVGEQVVDRPCGLFLIHLRLD